MYAGQGPFRTASAPSTSSTSSQSAAPCTHTHTHTPTSCCSRQTSEEQNKRRTTPVTFHFLHFVLLCNPTGKNWATHMTAQTQVHAATHAHTTLEYAHACTRSAARLMATFQLISRSVYPAASANTPPLPPPAASVTFLHGNIVCYEQCNSNFILHEVTPAALITFFFFF